VLRHTHDTPAFIHSLQKGINNSFRFLVEEKRKNKYQVQSRRNLHFESSNNLRSQYMLMGKRKLLCSTKVYNKQSEESSCILDTFEIQKVTTVTSLELYADWKA